MPKLSNRQDVMDKWNILVYGKPKTRKSTWVWKTCTQTHNVIYLDFDGCGSLSELLTDEQLERIFYLPMYRNTKNAIAALGALLTSGKTLWDEVNQSFVDVASTQGDKEQLVSAINLNGNPGKSTIVVVDGWTKITHGFAEMIAGPGKGLEWNQYSEAFVKCMALLAGLQQLATNTVVLSHSEHHIEYDAKQKAAKVKDPDIVAELDQPMSISKKHSEVFAGMFNQVYFTTLNHMGETMISTKASPKLITGGRLTPPQQVEYTKIGIGEELAKYGSSLSEIPSMDNIAQELPLGEARDWLRGKGAGAGAVTAKASSTFNFAKHENKA